MLGGLSRALGKMEQVEINLHGGDASNAVMVGFRCEDPGVIWSNDLYVGASCIWTHAKLLSDLSRVGVDIDSAESELREAVERPGSGQAGKRVVNAETVQLS